MLYMWALAELTLLWVSTTGVTPQGGALTEIVASAVSRRELQVEYGFVGTTTNAFEALPFLRRSGSRHLTSIVAEWM